MAEALGISVAEETVYPGIVVDHLGSTEPKAAANVLSLEFRLGVDVHSREGGVNVCHGR